MFPKVSSSPPEFAARKLLDVIMALGSDHSGKCFAWDGTEIDP